MAAVFITLGRKSWHHFGQHSNAWMVGAPMGFWLPGALAYSKHLTMVINGAMGGLTCNRTLNNWPISFASFPPATWCIHSLHQLHQSSCDFQEQFAARSIKHVRCMVTVVGSHWHGNSVTRWHQRKRWRCGFNPCLSPATRLSSW